MRDNNDRNNLEKKAPTAIEGEGSYSGTKDYNDRTEKFLAKNDPEALGKDAAEALEGDEGDDLRAAEKTAKSGEEGMQAKQRGDQAKGGKQTASDSGQRKKSEQDKRAIERSEGEGMIAKNETKKN